MAGALSQAFTGFHRLSRDDEPPPEKLSGLQFRVFAVPMLPDAARMLASVGHS